MKLLPLAVVLFACSCVTPKDEPLSGYFMRVEHRTTTEIANELAAEYPDVEFMAFGRNSSVFVYSRDESRVTMELLAKLEARVKELDRKEDPLSPK